MCQVYLEERSILLSGETFVKMALAERKLPNLGKCGSPKFGKMPIQVSQYLEIWVSKTSMAGGAV